MHEPGDKVHLLEEATVVELLQRAHDLAQEAMNRANGDGTPKAGREFAIASTSIEDAMMRYTRGRAIELHVFKPADLDSEDALLERRDFIDRTLNERSK